MESKKTIYDLPSEILQIILRMVIVGPNTGAYFCVNKFFNNTLNSMAKKYTLYNKFCCIVCYDHNFCRLTELNKVTNFGTLKKTIEIKGFKKQIIFDNVCNICLAKAFPRICVKCNVNFMSNYRGKNALCINCYDNFDMNNFIVLHVSESQDRCIRFKCCGCDCMLFASYYQFVTKAKTICYDCANNIGKKLIVLADGFPYVINTIRPTL